MKPLLFGIAALLVGLPSYSQTAQVQSKNNTNSTWLIMKEVVNETGLAMVKLEMKDMNQCEEQGALYFSSKKLGKWRHVMDLTGYICLEGK
tara:strand:+ start:278 stop:550 length:273 start_codon:yes stop_codon:yes gene_type:complete